MLTGLSRRFRRSFRCVGLMAVLAALVSQLALGAVVIPDDPQSNLAALDAASVFCQSGNDAQGGKRPPVQRHAADCALCPLTISLALSTVILTPEPLLPEPGLGRALPAGTRPQSRAPPSHAFAAAYPRGPPNLA